MNSMLKYVINRLACLFPFQDCYPPTYIDPRAKALWPITLSRDDNSPDMEKGMHWSIILIYFFKISNGYQLFLSSVHCDVQYTLYRFRVISIISTCGMQKSYHSIWANIYIYIFRNRYDIVIRQFPKSFHNV